MHDTLVPLTPGESTHYVLKPLNTGEILDRTFSIYRRNFWLFVGISVWYAVAGIVSPIVQLLLRRSLHLPRYATAFRSLPLAVASIVFVVLLFATYGLSQAASTYAVSLVLLGKTTDVGGAYRQAWLHRFRYPLLQIAQLFSAGWVTAVGYAALFIFAFTLRGSATSGLAAGFAGLLILLSFPYSMYRYIRVSLAVPASVVEDLGIRAALKRSKALLPDRKVRVLLVLLAIAALYMVLASMSVVISFISLKNGHANAIYALIATIVASFLNSLLVAPVSTISFALLYFDERIRREGYDIELMMQQNFGDATPQAESVDRPALDHASDLLPQAQNSGEW